MTMNALTQSAHLHFSLHGSGNVEEESWGKKSSAVKYHLLNTCHSVECTHSKCGCLYKTGITLSGQHANIVKWGDQSSLSVTCPATVIKCISRKWKQLNAENTYIAHSSNVQLIKRETKSTEPWSIQNLYINIQETEKDEWIHAGAEFTFFILYTLVSPCPKNCSYHS